MTPWDILVKLAVTNVFRDALPDEEDENKLCETCGKMLGISNFYGKVNLSGKMRFSRHCKKCDNMRWNAVKRSKS